jgi:hypothetical protein
MTENNLVIEKSEGGKSSFSKNTERNQKGKFAPTGGEKIGEHNFVKSGVKKGK